jgi:hypothetical protein
MVALTNYELLQQSQLLINVSCYSIQLFKIYRAREIKGFVQTIHFVAQFAALLATHLITRTLIMCVVFQW